MKSAAVYGKERVAFDAPSFNLKPFREDCRMHFNRPGRCFATSTLAKDQNLPNKKEAAMWVLVS
jgi:hypothetical protein